MLFDISPLPFVLFKYVSSSYTSRVKPKSDILHTIPSASKTLRAAKSR